MDFKLNVPVFKDIFSYGNATKARKRDTSTESGEATNIRGEYDCMTCRRCVDAQFDHTEYNYEHNRNNSRSGFIPGFKGHLQRKSEFSHEYGQHIDNSSHTLQRLMRLYASKEMSDVELVVGKYVHTGHRLILSCASDVFRVMLTNASWPEASSNRIVLNEESECEVVFGDFLRYIYCGTIHLTHDTALPVLKLADKYNITDLRQVCTEYMSSHLVTTVQQNRAVSWFQYAALCDHRELAKICQRFILWNFHKVLSTMDFYSAMQPSVLVFFLSHSELVIPDEFTLFQGVTRWLMHQLEKYDNNITEYKECAVSVMSCIRFPMMTPEQLAFVDKDPCADFMRDFLIERVVMSLMYHSRTSSERHLQLSDNDDDFVPRNYTNETWSTTLNIEDFFFLPAHDVRTLFFSSPLSAAQAEENLSWEWNLDLYPKGVQYEKCIMIGLWRNLELSGATYHKVRLVLETATPDQRTVDVSVLVTGVQDSVEYTKTVVEQRCMFDSDKRVSLIDNIIPYEELNVSNSSYLSGAHNSSFSIKIIVKPVLQK